MDSSELRLNKRFSALTSPAMGHWACDPLELVHVHQFGNFDLHIISPVGGVRLVVNTSTSHVFHMLLYTYSDPFSSLLSRRSRQRERLSASELSICLSVC